MNPSSTRTSVAPAATRTATSALDLAPREVRWSATMWVLAVAAGIFETLVVIVDTLVHHDMSAGALITGVGVRLVVFAVAIVLIMKMRRGANWARWTLAFLLGVIGLGSLLIGPVEWLAAGHTLSDLHLDLKNILFGVSRIIHVIAVITGLVLMFTATANRWFRPGARTTPANA